MYDDGDRMTSYDNSQKKPFNPFDPDAPQPRKVQLCTLLTSILRPFVTLCHIQAAYSYCRLLSFGMAAPEAAGGEEREMLLG